MTRPTPPPAIPDPAADPDDALRRALEPPPGAAARLAARALAAGSPPRRPSWAPAAAAIAALAALFGLGLALLDGPPRPPLPENRPAETVTSTLRITNDGAAVSVHGPSGPLFLIVSEGEPR